MDYLMMALVAAFICVGIALVVLLIELVKIMKKANTTIEDITAKVNPILDDAKTMTNDLVPVVKKVEPIVDRAQLTLDAVNLELMRVDEIMEDVSVITDAAASATTAVDKVTNAPIKAVNNVATRVRSSLGPKAASEESAELVGEQAAVERALADFKAAQAGEEDEPNFEGFEKIVADGAPEADDASAEVAQEAADADASAEESSVSA